jgi:hypothetical protein
MAIQRNGYFGSHNPAPFMEEADKLISGKSFNSAQLLETFLRHEAAQHGKSVPCEQTPQSIFAIDAILAHTVNPRIIIMVRDPREVLLSQKGKWKRRKLSGGKIPLFESIRSRINYHPVTISRLWKSTQNETLRFSHHPAVKIVRYEDLTDHPEQTIKEVCSHCRIDYEAIMTDVPVAGSSNFEDSTDRRGVERTRRNKWEKGLSKAEISICESINSSLMMQFGYRLSNIQNPGIGKVLYQLVYPFQLLAALLFNLKRFKDPKRLIKRFWG